MGRSVHSIIYIHAYVLSFVQHQPNSETKPFTYIIVMPQKLRALIYVFRSRSPVRTLILYPIFFYFLLPCSYVCTYVYFPATLASHCFSVRVVLSRHEIHIIFFPFYFPYFSNIFSLFFTICHVSLLDAHVTVDLEQFSFH